ncbi:pentapeptide repeat-containing protein [Herbaspirillum sp. GCM10030257]|uniref:anti-phage Hailong system effector protein HalA n=1 Tax=Herbaspirillum sp. GCM10030257 TaxID=3273393 RepID=UPI00361783B0
MDDANHNAQNNDNLAVAPTATARPAPQANYKRRKNFWEPVYKPEGAHVKFPYFDWNLDNSKGPKSSTCTAEDLALRVERMASFTISDASFSTCDFEGSFNFARLTFKSCVFWDCDFARSQWSNVKFSKCEFKRCSFSTTSLSDCQFLECTWQEMGYSAEEMKLERVLVTNPNAFVQAAYTNRDAAMLQQQNVNVEHQVFRLEKTKVKVAKLIMAASEDAYDDDAFYEAVMAYTTQTVVSRTVSARFHFRSQAGLRAKLKWGAIALVSPLEGVILKLSGWINGWGGKVGRAALCGVGLIFFFSFCYWFLGFQTDYPKALLASLEVTLLVGFTKYTTVDTNWYLQIGYAINMILGLWWYAVFVPTVISRISRTKQ